MEEQTNHLSPTSAPIVAAEIVTGSVPGGDLSAVGAMIDQLVVENSISEISRLLHHITCCIHWKFEWIEGIIPDISPYIDESILRTRRQAVRVSKIIRRTNGGSN